MVQSFLDGEALAGWRGRETRMETASGKLVRSDGEWRGVIEAAGRSGMTMKGFCRAQGIDYEQYLYHRRRIRKEDAGTLAMARSCGSAPVPGARPRAFIPVEVGSGRGMRLSFPRGLTLEFDAAPEAAWLVEVAYRWVSAGTWPC
jgi:hypothetical protein